MSWAIKIDNLSKLYPIGGATALGSNLREDLTNLVRRMFGHRPATPTVHATVVADSSLNDAPPNHFWALRDVNLEIAQGEVIGIIGRNGAGKSTLLKILSRITLPSHGEIKFRGRMASLLEVGTGFHRELTGRENIFLNGSILGMRRSEITGKLDEIVEFAEIGKFLDTPVKFYSSGMYVRLAFAVAANLETDILVIDEVLAVGDAQFQKKCLGKMGDVSRQKGKTVLFVSHALGAISTLTRKTAYLRAGRVEAFCPTPEAVNRYLSDAHQKGSVWVAPLVTPHPLQITSLRLLDHAGAPAHEAEASEGFHIELEYIVREPLTNSLVEVYIMTSGGTHLMTLGDHDRNPQALAGRPAGRYRVRIAIPGNLLNLGSYYLQINSARVPSPTFDYCETISFEIIEHKQRTARANRRGLLVPLLPWEVISHTPL